MSRHTQRPVLVTGSAGFIGSHLALQLLQAGRAVVGLDNLNSYYDPQLKLARLERLGSFPHFKQVRADLADEGAVRRLFVEEEPGSVVHLGAQAGVRHSLDAPHSYIASNITGFLNVLEGCRRSPVDHLVFASTSSVYGLNGGGPASVHQGADHPISLYAATKKSNEMMAHAYAHLFRIPVTGLRFFTVYGPWGRPDMALFKFTRAILSGEPIHVFNGGQMRRDFTYIDDIVEGIARVLDRPPGANEAWDSVARDPATSSAPYRILNIGRSRTEDLMRYIEVLEQTLGRPAVKRFLPMQPGDVQETWADIEDTVALTGYQPRVSIEEGVPAFVEWYRTYYRA